MAEMLAFYVRLLVVRCLAFVVVQALMMARQVTAGRAEAVCVSTVSFGLQRRGFGPFENLVRRFIGRALFNGVGRCYVSAFAFAVRRSSWRSVKLY